MVAWLAVTDMVPDMGDGPAGAAGDRHPLAWVRSLAVAQVVAILAGILGMASGIEELRITRSTIEPGIAEAWTDQWPSVWVAGAGLLVAVAALVLWGRARWLRNVQIIIWICELVSSIAITGLVLMLSPRAIFLPVLAWLAVGDVAVLISIVVLDMSRPTRETVRPGVF
jgi:hypothetical protein